MDYIYAPPPPAPPLRSSSGNSKSTAKKSNLKNERKPYRNQPLSGPKVNINNSKNPSSGNSNTTQSDGPVLGLGYNVSDLPVHLPNSKTMSDQSGAPQDLARPKVSNDLTLVPKDSQFTESGPDVINSDSGSELENEETVIQGTNIVLRTEEDIAKWIEERKRNWPTKRNIEAKEKSDNEKLLERKLKAESKRSSGNDEVKSDQTTRDKRRVCKYHAIGKCRHGQKCRNLHNNEERKAKIPNRFGPIENKSKSLFNMLRSKEYDDENATFLDFLVYMEQRGVITD